MEAKKTLKADLQHRRVLFFEIGMIVSLLIVVLAFAWNKKEVEEPIFMPPGGGGGGPVTEMVPITREPPKGSTRPQQQKQQSMDIIRIVMNETEIMTEVDFNEFNMDAIFADGASGPMGQAGGTPGGGDVSFGDEIFDVAEDMPKFMGKDMSAFQPWVQSKIEYPREAQRQGLQGRVLVEFIIEKDGSLSNIVARGNNVETILANEAIRVIKTSPKWTPAKQRNRPVRLKFTIPVNFRLVG